MTRTFSRALASSAGALLLDASSPARAEPTIPSSPAEVARSLFYEARALMQRNDLEAACPKLEESLRLEYGIGTEFNLADCNEKLGKIATAWSGFVNVAATARARDQERRAAVARDRAAALEGRLPKLAIEIVDPPAPDLEVRRDGLPVGPASWNVAAPVDPGPHRITASAPGRLPWEGTVTAFEGTTARVVVPPLAAIALQGPSGPPGDMPAPPERPPLAAEHTPPLARPRVVDGGRAQRTVGWVTGAVGLAALGVGAGFGLDSLRQRERAKAHCDGDVCDPRGLSLRDRAIASGEVATIASVAAGAALIGGLVLVLTAPRSSRHDQENASALRVVPHLATNGGGLVVRGVLP